MESDGELVRRSAAGCREATERLVERWASRVLAVCRARVGKAEVAEDLAQEALLRALRALPTLADPDKFGPWVSGVAAHTCLDWLKAKERTTVPFSVLEPNGSGMIAENRNDERRERIDEVWNAVAELPVDHRETLTLFYYDRMSYRDIAATLGVSSATVNARLTQARAMLREKLTEAHR